MLLVQRTLAFDLSTTEPHMCIHEVRMPPLCVRNQDVGARNSEPLTVPLDN